MTNGFNFGLRCFDKFHISLRDLHKFTAILIRIDFNIIVLLKIIDRLFNLVDFHYEFSDAIVSLHDFLLEIRDLSVLYVTLMSIGDLLLQNTCLYGFISESTDDLFISYSGCMSSSTSRNTVESLIRTRKVWRKIIFITVGVETHIDIWKLLIYNLLFKANTFRVMSIVYVVGVLRNTRCFHHEVRIIEIIFNFLSLKIHAPACFGPLQNQARIADFGWNAMLMLRVWWLVRWFTLMTWIIIGISLNVVKHISHISDFT